MEQLTPGGTLLVVRDLGASLGFYQSVLGLETVGDYGIHVALTGGVSLQTLDAWVGFLDVSPRDVRFGGHDAELYFEAADFDAFLKTIQDLPETALVHPPREHRWGQRAVRLYDPDGHIVEVGESLAAVARRFRDGGLNEEGVARRMEVPLAAVRAWLEERA